MAKYDDKVFRLGDYWLGQRVGSPAWYRMWYDVERKRTLRASLDTTDFEEAKERLTEWFVLNQNGSANAAEDPDLASVLVRYWEEHGSEATSASTIRAHLRYWSEFHAEMTVPEATAYHQLEAFKRHLYAKGLSSTSVNRVLAMGKAAFRMAWQQGHLKHVPPLKMEPVGDQEPMGRPLSVKECAGLVETALIRECHHVALFIMLASGTAARPGALLELTRGQIDFEHGLIELNPRGRSQNKKIRPTVKLPAMLGQLLAPLEDARADTPVVQYKGVAVKSLKTAWGKVRKQAGLDASVTLYSFRHTLARHMRAKGVPAWEVAAQLGHKIAGTTDRYAPFSPDFLSNAVQAIDQFLDEVTRQIRASDETGHSAKYLEFMAIPRGLEPRTC